MFDWLRKLWTRGDAQQREAENVVHEKGETVFYRPHWHSFDTDGTIHISVSVYDSESHSSCDMAVRPNDPDYTFWCWIVEIPKYQCSIKEDQIASARNQFEWERSAE